MRQGKTLGMEELMEGYLKKMKLFGQYKEREVLLVWEEVVGEMIAKRTKTLRISEGKLWVSFSSAVVKNDILLAKEGLLKALNDRVGGEVVKDIIVF